MYYHITICITDNDLYDESLTGEEEEDLGLDPGHQVDVFTEITTSYLDK